jgi:integrase
VFDVTAYPLFQQALASVPMWERDGPLVTDDNGSPVRRRYYWDLYRDVADAAGVPRSMWSMHARHGGATEAQQAGVDLAGIAEHAQHSDINTTRKHYIVPSVETSRRVELHTGRRRRTHRENSISNRISNRFPTGRVKCWRARRGFELLTPDS